MINKNEFGVFESSHDFDIGEICEYLNKGKWHNVYITELNHKSNIITFFFPSKKEHTDLLLDSQDIQLIRKSITKPDEQQRKKNNSRRFCLQARRSLQMKKDLLNQETKQ